MPYVYLLQPAEFINTDCYKIGISSKCDLNRLKSYGNGSRYIQYFECDKYMEAEKELIHILNNTDGLKLFKGREYFCGDKNKIVKAFMKIMNKYVEIDLQNGNKDNSFLVDLRKLDYYLEINKAMEHINNLSSTQYYIPVILVLPDDSIYIEKMKNSIDRLKDKEIAKIYKKLISEKKLEFCKLIGLDRTVNNFKSKNSPSISIITPNNPILMERFIMSMEEIQNEQNNHIFLQEMESEDYDIVNSFDKSYTKLNKIYENMIDDHNTNCKAHQMVYKIDENGEQYREKINYTPLTHPEYKFECEHEKANFKLSENIVSKIFLDTFLDINDKIVVTHDDSTGEFRIIFKYRGKLLFGQILQEFLKVNKREFFDLSDDFDLAKLIKNNYKEYFKKLNMNRFGRFNSIV